MSQSTSAGFEAEVATSHTAISYVQVVTPHQGVFEFTTTDGSVQADRTAAVRRRISATGVDFTGQYTPEGLESALAPGGSEIRAFRGVIYANGSVEVVSLGVFRISSVTVADGAQGLTLQAEGYDRSWQISRAKFETPYMIPAGTNVVGAVKSIISRTYPDTRFDATGNSLATTVPIVYDAGSDPWQAATSLAASVGCEVFFDTDASVVIAAAPDIDALPSPRWTFQEGKGTILTDLQKKLTAEPGYNGVIVVGSSPADSLPAVRAEAWDTLPGSPTYYLGPYGRVPKFVQDSNVKTQNDAQNRADAELRGLLGFASSLSLTTSVNPAIGLGDCARVERELSRVSGLYLIDALTIPLGLTTQSILLRQRRLS
ncbi:DUF5047 domain-containing protein [Streptomyces sp. NPDC055085]